MDTFTSSPPADPTVMVEQIRTRAVNVQELMKQNAEFKQRGRPENQGHPKNSNTSLVQRN